MYGKKWHKQDVVGCGIEVDKDGNTFNIGYYLNGEYLGIAYSNCKYSGNLYPACSLQPGFAYGQFIFDPNSFKFLPDGYEAIV